MRRRKLGALAVAVVVCVADGLLGGHFGTFTCGIVVGAAIWRWSQ